MKQKSIDHQVQIPGRENLQLQAQLSSTGELSEIRLFAIGGPDFLHRIQEWRAKIVGQLLEVELPVGNSIADILLRELLLKAQGLWKYPYQDRQLCHCRAVPTSVVDEAVICGAHTPEEVSRQTSASTACGTCRPDVEEIIKYRTGS